MRAAQENASALEDKDFQIVRCLIKLLETSQDAKVLAIACNDLGMFAEAHPHGRYIINDLGGKAHVMAHMTSSSPEVQKYALLCVQRLMLGRDKLDFLKRPGRNGGASVAI
jgi:V-type H+-transporting ATPase subunit H